ncbi:NAD(P)/FAD-dependent oxidoreductase [Polaromonas sp. SM01]|uniref:NAD(P)/FAD-dependent oxidoreductase n=1 Tax=Polaromonas sp. SM01 TaxID=3085630 RepID=UPI002980ACBF|nr:NAD(P)/FAD-dependent oxidoreductase [Polaromonas sp. SM01]MDW5444268.1 NAD(P)/FAD-dependent oxidoreductase [Polaromonas sp. SM01]
MIQTDALVIGAGPVGLFQVFQLGLLEIQAHVVDSLPHPGGQCMELYPDKPIYDIPGVLRYTGRELVANLLKQIEPFAHTFHLGQEVRVLEQRPDGRFFVETSRGSQFLAKTIIVAAGVGAFQPKLLKIDGLDKFNNSQLFYRVDHPDHFVGKKLVIVGGDDAALDWACRLATEGKTASVTLLHRRDVFQAAPEATTKIKALCNAGKMRFEVGQVTGYDEKDGRLVAAQVTDVEGQTHPLPLDALLVLLGLSPKLGPVAHWGLDMERKQLLVDTEKFSTSIPGIFAVGDINTYPGKKKLILSGFHESALAAFGAAALVFPDKKIMLQYTTTSPRLHQLLGVDGGT